MKTHEEEVPDSELNPYRKKKKKRLDFQTYRQDTGDGREYIFEDENE